MGASRAGALGQVGQQATQGAVQDQLAATGQLAGIGATQTGAAAGSMADCLPVTDKIGHLQSICPDCYCLMNRRVSLAKLDDFHRILAITFTKAPEQVSNRIQPTVTL